MHELVVHILLETKYTDRLAKHIHPVKRKVVSKQFPPLLVLMKE